MSNKSSITILQLTRFGDVLQTLWAVKDLKNQNPDIQLNLVTRSRFGKPLEFLLRDHFTNICYLSSEDLISEDLTKGIDSKLAEVNSWNSKVLVNLSFSKSSAYLSNLILADFKLGLVANEFGGVQPIGSWSEYVYSSVMRGPLNPFSLVDIFKFILGNKYKSTLPIRNISGTKIIIHPFASQKRKAWNSSKWSEILYSLLKNNSEINLVLVGSVADAEECKIICDNPLLDPYRSQIKSECGTLSLEELSKELQSAFLFCGHDSMVGHLASVAGIQCLTISLGSVRVHETTPYGLNNYVLAPKTDCFPCFPDEQCIDFKCHKDMGYKVTSECIQQLIDSSTIDYSKLSESISPIHLSTVNIYKTSFSQIGLFNLESITKEEQTLESLLRKYFRIVWLYMLEETEESSSFPDLNQNILNKLGTFIPNLKQLFELSEFGKKYSRFILEEISKEQPDLEYIKSCGKKIEEIDQMQVLIGKASPGLNPIIDFYNLKKSNMAGNNLVELCTSSHQIYQSIGSFCNILYELIEKSVNNYNSNNVSMKEAKE